MSNPLIYVYETQVRDAHEALLASQATILDAVGFGFDDGDVYHVYTSPPVTHLSGAPCPSAILFLAELPSLEQAMSISFTSRDTLLEHRRVDSPRTAVIIIFAIKSGRLNHRAFVLDGAGQCQQGNLRFIPEHSDLYSRSRGLLETNALEQKTVAIVGLGSGGSATAVELAKAGVGNFLLIDFDRLELGNISRHVCGIGDLGRYKTRAVRDCLYGKNPYVNVEVAEYDINTNIERTGELLERCDLMIGATDNDRSRFNLNAIALEKNVPAIFGRALTRAVGGDVLRVRPYQGPCLCCVFTRGFLAARREEVSQFRQARDEAPAYIPDDEVEAEIQVGLSSDIMPICNMVSKLALVELSRGIDCGISSVDEDLSADFYIWANRRERVYSNWPKMEYGFRTPSILRWYGAHIERTLTCPACGDNSKTVLDDDNIFST